MRYKKIKRLLSIVLAGTMAFTAIPATKISVQAEGILKEERGVVEEEVFSGTWAELHAILAERMEKAIYYGETKVHVSDLNIYRDDYLLGNEIRYYSPYFDNEVYPTVNVDANGKYEYINVDPRNYDGTVKMDARNAKIDRALQELKDYVNQGTTDEEKVFLFFEYMATNYEYDQKAASDSYDFVIDDYTPYSSSGLLQNNSGVCNAYAHLMMYVLHDLGIECHRVSSPSMNHTWNLIKIDGAYYHVDATFAANKYGFVSRDDNFLLSDETILATDSHAEWNSIDITADSKKYEDAYWRTVTSQIIYEGDMAYYITGSKLVARNRITNEVTEVKDLEGAKDCNVFLRNGMLYYNTATEIRKMNFDGSEDTLVLAPELTEGQSLYGCREKNGNLEYGVKSSDSKDLPDHVSIVFPDQPVAESIAFDAEPYEIGYAASEFPTYTLTPANSRAEITWTSSNANVVSVDEEGMITAHALGTAVLTATLENGASASCTVNVVEGEEFTIIFTKWGSGDVQIPLDLEPITVRLGGKYQNLPKAESDEEGYVFNLWYCDRGHTGNWLSNSSRVMERTAYLQATFKGIEYPITYVLNGGTETSSMKISYQYDKDIARTIGKPIREGYFFEGWYTEADFINSVEKIEAGEMGAKTFYAKWEEKETVISAVLEELNAYKNPADYREAQQEEIEAFIENAMVKMNDVGTIKEVEQIAADTKAELDWLKTDAQLAVEESWGPMIEAADDSWDIPVEVLNATAGNEESGRYGAMKVLDNDTTTLWHTSYSGTPREVQWIQFELNDDYQVKGLRYLPREFSESQYGSSNGVITEYIIQTSNDGETWKNVDHERWDATNGWKLAWFAGEPVKYVRLKVEDGLGNVAGIYNGERGTYYHASAAEIRLVGGKMYSLSYELNGGTNHAENPSEYAYDSIALLLKPAQKEGVVFEGWYADSSLTEKIAGIPALSSGEKMVYAKYITRDEATKDIIKELENYKNLADYREAQQEELAKAIADGKAAIEAATNVDEVRAAAEAAKVVLDGIKSNAQLTAEEEALAAATLAQAKEEAKEELSSYKKLEDYREAQQEELANAIAEGNQAIDQAENLESVRRALVEAKAKLDAIKTDAELTEEEKNTITPTPTEEPTVEPTAEPTVEPTKTPEVTPTPELTEAPQPTVTEAPQPTVTEAPQPSETPGVTENVTKVFSDVHKDWYADYVQYVYDNGLMTGIKGTTKFAPNANITKAQVAQVLYNMDGQPTITDKSVFIDLKDVPSYEWYANAVAWAYSTGVVTGDTNAKKFFPNADVTREQLAIMMFRYAQYKGYDTSATSDLAGLKNAENTSNWALTGVKWAVGAGLISGIEKNGVKDLAPQGNATRAQVAAILMRFCEK